MNDPPSSGVGGPRQFKTTRWHVVRAASDGSSPETEQALTTFCQTYWYPLAYLRWLDVLPKRSVLFTVWAGTVEDSRVAVCAAHGVVPANR